MMPSMTGMPTENPDERVILGVEASKNCLKAAELRINTALANHFSLMQWLNSWIQPELFDWNTHSLKSFRCSWRIWGWCCLFCMRRDSRAPWTFASPLWWLLLSTIPLSCILFRLSHKARGSRRDALMRFIHFDNQDQMIIDSKFKATFC